MKTVIGLDKKIVFNIVGSDFKISLFLQFSAQVKYSLESFSSNALVQIRVSQSSFLGSVYH